MMLPFIDQLGKRIMLKSKPARIVSLVPSQSEFLWDLGLQKNLVGITKFCIHPDAMFRSVQRVGGTKELDIEQIRKLQPDLIIGNKEENNKQQIEILSREFNVWMSDIYNFDDAFAMMEQVGAICGCEKKAQDIIDNIRLSLSRIQNIFNGQRILYFIWHKPYMVAAGNNFINHVINYAGLQNALATHERYPDVSEDQLQRVAPDFCFLSSEPFPFSQKHAQVMSQLLPGSKMVFVDGEIFSWYGSGMLRIEKYMLELKQRLG